MKHSVRASAVPYRTASPSTFSATVMLVDIEERQGSVRLSWAPHPATGVEAVRLYVHPCMCL